VRLDPAPPVGRDDAAQAAVRELSRPEYHRDDPSLLQRIADAVQRAVSHALARAAEATPGGIPGLLILLALVVVAVVLVRVRLGALPVRDLLGDRRAGARARTAQDYRDEADRLAATGDHAEALRATTRALVRELEDRGVVEPRPGRTTTGIVRRVADTVPAAAGDAAAVAQAFEAVWYGGQPATPAGWQAARDAELRVHRGRLAVTGTGTGTGTRAAAGA